GLGGFGGAGGGLGAPAPGMLGGRPAAPAKDAKDETASKKRAADDRTEPATAADKLAKELESLGRAAGIELGKAVGKPDVSDEVQILGMRFKSTTELRAQLHENLHGDATKEGGERKQALAAEPADRNRTGARPTDGAPAEQPAAGTGEMKRLGEAGDRGEGLPAEAKPVPPAPVAAARPIAVHLGPMRPQWLAGPDGA